VKRVFGRELSPNPSTSSEEDFFSAGAARPFGEERKRPGEAHGGPMRPMPPPGGRALGSPPRRALPKAERKAGGKAGKAGKAGVAAKRVEEEEERFEIRIDREQVRAYARLCARAPQPPPTMTPT